MTRSITRFPDYPMIELKVSQQGGRHALLFNWHVLTQCRNVCSLQLNRFFRRAPVSRTRDSEKRPPDAYTVGIALDPVLQNTSAMRRSVNRAAAISRTAG